MIPTTESNDLADGNKARNIRDRARVADPSSWTGTKGSGHSDTGWEAGNNPMPPYTDTNNIFCRCFLNMLTSDLISKTDKLLMVTEEG